MPEIALIRVDLPAPLSPTRATTSPAPTSKSTSVSARTAPKLLLTPFSSSRGVFGPAAGCVAVTSVTSLLPLRRGPLRSLSHFRDGRRDYFGVAAERPCADHLHWLLQAGLLAPCRVRLGADLCRRVQTVLDHGALYLVGRDRDRHQDHRRHLLLPVFGLPGRDTTLDVLALGQ